MKFLIATDVSGKGFKTQASALQSADFGGFLDDLFFEKSDHLMLISSRQPGRVAGDRVFWDGAAIDRDIAFSGIDPVVDAPERVCRYLHGLLDGQAPNNLTGIFGGALIGADGSVVAAPDPVSQYALFYWQAGDRTIVANCLHLIEAVLRQEGNRASRDFASNAYEFAFGAGAWTRTGLAGVHKVPPHHFVLISGGKLQLNPMPGNLFAPVDQADYSSLLSAAAGRLKEAASALSARYPGKGLLLDLSGGKDTRLVLGSFLASGNRQFQVFLGGAPDGEDRKIATRLVRHFGLTQGEYLSNLGGEKLSPIDTARRSAYRFEGTSSLFQAVPGRERLSGVAQVRGGSSEAKTRSFYRLDDAWRPRGLLGGAGGFLSALAKGKPLATERLLADVTGKLETPAQVLPFLLSARGGRVHRFMTRSFLKGAYDSFAGNMAELSALGIPDANLADAYYIHDRGWRHCGFATQVMNGFRPVFEPLNDPCLLAAQMSLGTVGRDNARVARDLFAAFDVPDLLEMPFEGADWPGELSGQLLARREELSRISSEPIEPDAGLFPDGGGQADSIYSMGGEAYMKAVQPYMLALAGDLPISSSVWDYMQRDRLLEAIEEGTFAQPRFAHDGVRLLHALIWMQGDEARG
ncbi:MAG: hypothetical protein HWE25_16365 [Alphaproteobacteria bacterium]|nr:hypothetical protein [Alphaproteobacteria bacterium]